MTSNISIRASRKSDIPFLKQMQQTSCDTDIQDRIKQTLRSLNTNWRMWLSSTVVSGLVAVGAGAIGGRFQGQAAKPRWALTAGLVTQSLLSYTIAVTIPKKIYGIFNKMVTDLSALEKEDSAAFVAVRTEDPKSVPLAMVCILNKDGNTDSNSNSWGWGTGAFEFSKVYVSKEVRGQGVLHRLMKESMLYVETVDSKRKEKAKREGMESKDFLPTRAVAATSDFATWEVIVPTFAKHGFKAETIGINFMIGKFSVHKMEKVFPGL